MRPEPGRRDATTETPKRYFKLKPGRSYDRVAWLDRHTVYEGTLISMTRRVVRLFAPEAAEAPAHVDLSYDWVTPVR